VDDSRTHGHKNRNVVLHDIKSQFRNNVKTLTSNLNTDMITIKEPLPLIYRYQDRLKFLSGE
jgi:hypothetical protein